MCLTGWVHTGKGDVSDWLGTQCGVSGWVHTGEGDVSDWLGTHWEGGCV